jgi:Zn-dependent protease with chaperone function
LPIDTNKKGRGPRQISRVAGGFSMEVYCGRCGVINRSDRIFCLRCRGRLFPSTNLDLSLNDFVYPGDQTNLSVVQDAGWIPALFAGHRIRGQEAAMRQYLSRSAVRVKDLSNLDLIMRSCADQLGLGLLPDAFVVPSTSLNAAVMGSERSPVFVVTHRALEVLDEPELGMLVGHELAHIKSRHMLYHTAAESMATGGSLLASFFGAGAVAYPLQMSLLAWHRESEVTADRAAVLLGGDVSVFASMLAKTLFYNGGSDGGGAVAELFRTHPEHQRRLALAREFVSSLQYAKGRDKLRRRREAAGSSIPFCASCGSPKQSRANYCGSCGRSLK